MYESVFSVVLETGGENVQETIDLGRLYGTKRASRIDVDPTLSWQQEFGNKICVLPQRKHDTSPLKRKRLILFRPK
jgi:hypothetical protein